MQTCEFCQASFKPHPQVKRARACSKVECQKQRQRSNEREWRERHQFLYDSRYHQIKRIQRAERLKSIGEQFQKCLDVRCSFLDIDVDIGMLKIIFE